jgi:hypothetical protein
MQRRLVLPESQRVGGFASRALFSSTPTAWPGCRRSTKGQGRETKNPATPKYRRGKIFQSGPGATRAGGGRRPTCDLLLRSRPRPATIRARQRSSLERHFVVASRRQPAPVRLSPGTTLRMAHAVRLTRQVVHRPPIPRSGSRGSCDQGKSRSSGPVGAAAPRGRGAGRAPAFPGVIPASTAKPRTLRPSRSTRRSAAPYSGLRVSTSALTPHDRVAALAPPMPGSRQGVEALGPSVDDQSMPLSPAIEPLAGGVPTAP